MNNYIYCETIKNMQQAFYLSFNRKKYFLFAQPYRQSNKETFSNGCSLFDLKKIKKNHSFSVRHTANKIPVYLKYLEKEYDISLMRTKKKKLNQTNRRVKIEECMIKETY